ncbi:MAG: transposase [Oscillospiraceae bacterium]
MELPKRKKLRLNGYEYSSCGAYFVTICVKDRRELLGEIIVGDDAHIVPYIKLSQYGMVVQKYMNGIIGINKCVIMPNHIHMIIVIGERENGRKIVFMQSKIITICKSMVYFGKGCLYNVR